MNVKVQILFELLLFQQNKRRSKHVLVTLVQLC